MLNDVNMKEKGEAELLYLSLGQDKTITHGLKQDSKCKSEIQYNI